MTWTKEQIKKHYKEYCQEHKEEKKEYDKKRYQKNKEKMDEKHREYYYKNIEKIRKKRREYYQKPMMKAKRKEYNKRNRKKRLKLMREYNKRSENKKRRNENKRKRLKTDKNFRIKLRLGNLLRNILKNYTKTGKVKPSKKYGINWNKVIKHLEPFPEDISLYHVDHIKPLCSFNLENPEEIKKAFSPENHQWLTVQENLVKGRKIS